MTVSPADPSSSAARWDTTPAALRSSTPRSNEWAQRLVDFGGIGSLSATYAGYSMPVERGASKARRVFRRPGWPGAFRVPLATTCVVGSVRPASGRDGHKVAIDEDGHEVDYWGLSWPGVESWDLPQFAGFASLDNIARGFNPRAHALAASVVPCRRSDGAWMGPDDTGNVSGFICAPLSRGVTTVDEVRSGVVRHALRCSTPVPLAGLQAPLDVGMDDPRIGVTWAAAGLPCGTVEGVTERGQDKTRMIPHGLHVSVERSDAEIEADLDAAGLVGGERDVSRVLRVAARDYGVVSLLSTPAGTSPTVQLDGSTPGEWAKLGVTRNGSRLLSNAVPSAGCLRALAWPEAPSGISAYTHPTRARQVDAMTVPLQV